MILNRLNDKCIGICEVLHLFDAYNPDSPRFRCLTVLITTGCWAVEESACCKHLDSDAYSCSDGTVALRDG